MAKGRGETFEASLERLEKIIGRLEGGGISLDESLQVFEEGMRLVKLCEARLNEVQRKIEVLMKDSGGKKVSPFEAAE